MCSCSAWASQRSDAVTITQAHLISGPTAGLRKGDVWSLQDLLYDMLLVSGNDAALAIADHVGRTVLAEKKTKASSIKRFVQEMRAAAAALGARHTQFGDPYGLSPLNISTARDVGLMGHAIFRDPRLLPFLGLRAANAIHRRPKRPNRHRSTAPSRSSGRRYPWGEDRIACRQEHLSPRRGVAGAKRADHRRGGPGQCRPPLPLNDMRTILAALPKDFPELAEPAAPPGAASKDGGVTRCL